MPGCMKVIPTANWRLLGTDIELSIEETYEATLATNQPDYKAREAIFAGKEGRTMLLEKGEYVIVG